MLCAFLVGKMTQCKEMFPVYCGKCLSHKATRPFESHRWCPTRCVIGWDNNQKTSVLQVSMDWWSNRTSLSMLVEDMSRNKCSFQVQISHVLRFISICDLFTDCPSYMTISLSYIIYQSDWGMKLISHLCLVVRWRTGSSIPPLSVFMCLITHTDNCTQ
jgi:hypothetical protein